MKKALSLILALVLCLSLCACGDGDNVPITGTLTANTQDLTTEATNVPIETTESAEEQMQKLIDYNKAVDLIDSLSNIDMRICDDDWEIMQKAYNILLALGEYKNAPELLACFAEYSCCEVDYEKTLYDSDGNVVAWLPMGLEILWCSHEYDEDNRIVRTDYTSSLLDSGYETYEYDTDAYSATRYCSGVRLPLGGLVEEHTVYCKFDEKWQLIEEILGSHRYVYTYDNDGKLLSKSVVNSEGLCTNTYTATYTTVYLYTPLQ